MSKKAIKNLLIDFITDYDPNKWSNDDVYEKYAEKIDNVRSMGEIIAVTELTKKVKKLEHRLANCIEPKFKIGDKVWAVYWQTFIGEKYNYEIVSGKIDHLFIDRDNQISYGTMCQSFREQNLFATEEEAKAKLEEMKNG